MAGEKSTVEIKMSSMNEKNVETVSGGKKAAPKAIWSRSNLMVLCVLSITYFLGATLFACIAPFFPIVARGRRASETEIGLVFGVMQLVIFLLSPLCGKYASHIGIKFMFSAGLFIAAWTAILFGLLDMCPMDSSFISLGIVIRAFEGVGSAAYMTAAFSIVAHRFPGKVATVIGILEVFNGMGFMLGPPLGGILFKLGSFHLPFTTFGLILLAFAVVSVFVETVDNTEELMPVIGKNAWLLVFKPDLFLALFSIFVGMMTISFFDPTLAPHLEALNLEPEVLGLLFLLLSATYSLTSPLVGVIVDKWHCTLQVMAFGFFISGIGILLIGPVPYLPLELSLTNVCIGQAIYGCGLGITVVTSYHYCLHSTLKHGYPNNFSTYALVSGFYTSAFSLGAFVGPTLGGLLVDLIGFPWTSSHVATLNLIMIIFPILFLFWENKRDKQFADEMKTQSPPIATVSSKHTDIQYDIGQLAVGQVFRSKSRRLIIQRF
ncbi:MFS-type transporter SLC18B1 [Trichinella pseudospiralis]|uniref:MFS-type transporter SLC18B1 n=2 Tax=Trichinella pseudospiralis TaxID=6337 RepID=A0A0V1IS39_TRIPS|nr:MFS-type transporter SLC18B1 [Trichinella pseudospiralis]KRY68321.1 MFS-type transporter SLC18B1 [Trichinella pseudospiralis]KRY85875.1 MFS-type transporter SLC18B1 [Trichinella pseudospiralis]KRZ25561.1 MFS-type transporter SLC18B1 [Trichinella pseudospiralis]KRZ39367.1 MFS-type transporter SLC18B1 [Trichinella pseudospiralis]